MYYGCNAIYSYVCFKLNRLELIFICAKKKKNGKGILLQTAFSHTPFLNVLQVNFNWCLEILHSLYYYGKIMLTENYPMLKLIYYLIPNKSQWPLVFSYISENIKLVGRCTFIKRQSLRAGHKYTRIMLSIKLSSLLMANRRRSYSRANNNFQLFWSSNASCYQTEKVWWDIFFFSNNLFSELWWFWKRI